MSKVKDFLKKRNCTNCVEFIMLDASGNVDEEYGYPYCMSKVVTNSNKKMVCSKWDNRDKYIK